MSDRVPFHRTVFDHIPKTAGTSISAAMGEALGESAQRRERSCPHYLAIRTPGRRLIASHLWFYPGEPLAHDWFYATTLREPVDRILSLFYFHRDCLATEDDPHVAAASCGLEYYISLGAARGGSPDNAQSLHFAGRMCETPEWLKTADLMAAAVASLEVYDLVGTFDDVQGFTDRYCDALAVPRQRVPRLNVTIARVSKTHVSPGVINRLNVRNTVDAALYEWARQRCSRPDRPTQRTRTPAGPANFGNREIEILSVVCRGRDAEGAVIHGGDDIIVQLACLAHREEHDLTVGIAIRNERNEQVFGTNSQVLGKSLGVAVEQSFVVSLTLRLDLPAGRHGITLALHRGRTHHEGCYHWREDAAFITVLPADAATQARASSILGRGRDTSTVSIALDLAPGLRQSSYAGRIEGSP